MFLARFGGWTLMTMGAVARQGEETLATTVQSDQTDRGESDCAALSYSMGRKALLNLC